MSLLVLEVIPRWGIRNPFSALSHFAGLLLGALGMVVLVRKARARGGDQVWGLVVYSVSMMMTFAASTLFHTVLGPPERLDLFKRLDHAVIFIMIAGTCTIVFYTFRTSWTPWANAWTWTLALAGVVVKMIYWPMPLWLSAVTYLVVGWVGVAGVMACARSVGWHKLRLITAGALIYTLAAVVYVLEKPVLWPGVIEGHELFHVLVLVGAGFHFAFVYHHATARRILPSPAVKRALDAAPALPAVKRAEPTSMPTPRPAFAPAERRRT